MPRFLSGRCLVAVLTVAAAIGASGCGRKSEGAVQVLVIGDTPRLVDPGRQPVTRPDAVLLNNAAQGLVRLDARGQIEPGLAEAWNVSDDGLSYIFRLANGEWSNHRKITAEQVARILRRRIGGSSRDPLKDALGAVDDVVAMTDRVIEIRLKEPRPHLLQLLAQPEMALVYEGAGSGPFTIERRGPEGLRLVREIEELDEERPRREEVELGAASVEDAISAFADGKADLVLGGTFVDLPFVERGSLSRRALQFDPASGLFGLIPATGAGPLANPDIRRLLSEAIDRDALIAALSVPGLVSRTTVLEPGLDNVPDPVPPAWTATALAERRPALVERARRLFSGKEAQVTVALPVGPGADILFDRLAADWGALGVTVKRAGAGQRADLELVDEVAPSSSSSWFLRHFRCAVAPVCDEHVDELLQAARDTPVLAQRSALLTDASRQVDSQQLFIAIAAPIRWSLVSARITGFSGNRFAIHTLTALEQRLDRTGE
jgi:peptide/nickel transport system substrate-binding protein